MDNDRWSVLIGNSFPLGLIQRTVEIEPASLDRLRTLIGNGARVFSFWGHSSTLKSASEFLGTDLTPRGKRPALQVSQEGLPMLYGEVFDECWILAPVIRGGRPDVGTELLQEQIESWNLLLMRWKT